MSFTSTFTSLSTRGWQGGALPGFVLLNTTSNVSQGGTGQLMAMNSDGTQLAGHGNSQGNVRTYAIVNKALVLKQQFATGNGQIDSINMNTDGTYLVIGQASYQSIVPPSPVTGKIAIYTRAGNTWSLQQNIVNANANYMGSSVQFDSAADRVVVGEGPVSPGRAHVYYNSGGTWSLEQTISNPQPNNIGFGNFVSINNAGDTIIIGADSYPNGAGAGGAYVYNRANTTWSLNSILTASDGINGDQFGSTSNISADGNTIIISSIGTGNNNQGLYIFKNSGNAYIENQKLTPPAGESIGYGFNPVLSSTAAMVLIPWHTSNVSPTGTNTIIYCYGANATTSILQQQIENVPAYPTTVNFGLGLQLNGNGNLFVTSYGYSANSLVPIVVYGS